MTFSPEDAYASNVPVPDDSQFDTGGLELAPMEGEEPTTPLNGYTPEEEAATAALYSVEKPVTEVVAEVEPAVAEVPSESGSETLTMSKGEAKTEILNFKDLSQGRELYISDEQGVIVKGKVVNREVRGGVVFAYVQYEKDGEIKIESLRSDDESLSFVKLYNNSESAPWFNYDVGQEIDIPRSDGSVTSAKIESFRSNGFITVTWEEGGKIRYKDIEPSMARNLNRESVELATEASSAQKETGVELDGKTEEMFNLALEGDYTDVDLGIPFYKDEGPFGYGEMVKIVDMTPEQREMFLTSKLLLLETSHREPGLLKYLGRASVEINMKRSSGEVEPGWHILTLDPKSRSFTVQREGLIKKVSIKDILEANQ